MTLSTQLLSEATLRFVLLGMATGSLSALVGLAVVLVYRASGVLNFAAGALGAVGAFVCYSLRDDHGWPWVLALVAGLLVGAALGAATHLALSLIRGASLLTKLIATLALLSGAQGVMVVVWGTDVRQPESLLPTTSRTLFGDLRIGEDRLMLIGLVVVLAVGLRLVYAKTPFGLATSAVAEDRRVAASAGWSTATIELVNFTAAGALSALAAILLAPIVTLNAGVLSLSILAALAAALVGRFSSFSITVAAALLIGVIQSEVGLFLPELASAFGVREQALAGLPSLAPLAVILVYIVGRGRGRLARGEALVRLPLPGSGRVSVLPLVVGSALGALFLFGATTWQDAVITTLGISIVVCSVVVVTGYAGQLSLCQYALAGLGAWVSARLAEGGDVPFLVAMAVGVGVAVLVGVVVALPALRTRGVDLAIATLALALMINALIFTNSSATGGIGGVNVPVPDVFGVSVDPIEEPERYGAMLLAALVAVGLVVANLRRGRSGRRMLAVRSNERAAAALGVRVTSVKLYAFGLAAGIAAVGGTLLAFRRPQVQFGEFDVFGSILLVQYAVLGGLGWVSGALAGAVAAPGAIASRFATGTWPDVADIGSWLAILSAFGVVSLIRMAPDGIASYWSRTAFGRLGRVVTVPARRPVPDEPDVATRLPAGLVIDDVSVRFGGVIAVDGVSFNVDPGEIVGLIGPNGAGKTSLIDVVTGFAPAASGSIILGDVDVTGWNPERRARLGLARSWQSVDLFEEMSVRDNLLVACDRQDRRRFLTDLFRPGQQPLTRLAREVVDGLGLDDVLDERPSSLPQGHVRLVGIARAIVGRPAVLLLDEPAAGLAADEGTELVALIRTVARQYGIGVLVVEHDVPLLVDLCDRIVALDFGRKLAEGTPAEVTADERVIRSYLGEVAPAEVDA